MTFPGAGARIFRNEAGEVLGWDYPSYDPPELDPFEEAEADAAYEAACEIAEEELFEIFEETAGPDDEFEPDEATIHARAKEILRTWKDRR